MNFDKIIVTKHKVHKTCWKCNIPFLRHFHYRNLRKQGYYGQFQYHKMLSFMPDIWVNEKDITYEKTK